MQDSKSTADSAAQTAQEIKSGVTSLETRVTKTESDISNKANKSHAHHVSGACSVSVPEHGTCNGSINGIAEAAG